MSTIVTRAGKGSPLTWNEVDNNFTNLNTDKLQSGNTAAALTITSATINGGTITGTALNGTLGATTPSTVSATSVTVNGGTFGAATFTTNSVDGLAIGGKTGSTSDFSLYNPAGSIQLLRNPTGTGNLVFGGNVGIGTATPSSFNASADNLVVGTTSGDNGITIASGSANQGSLFFADGTTGGAQQAAGYLYYLHTNDSMIFGTTNIERMRLDSSGNLALGVSTAAAKFDVAFSDNSRFLLGFGANLDNYYTSGASGIHIFRSGETERMRLSASGGLSIGTTTNAGAYTILLGNASYANSPNFNSLNSSGQTSFGTQSTTAYGALAAGDGYVYTTKHVVLVSDSASGAIKFATGAGAIERMRIDSSGNLGLGVTPSAWASGFRAIDIGSGAFTGGNGSASNGAGVWYNSFYNGTNSIYKYNGNANYFEAGSAGFLWYRASSGTAGGTVTFAESMRLDSSGNLIVSSSASINAGCSIIPNGSRQTGNAGQASGWAFDTFYRSNVAIGSITQNGTTGVLYNLTSDYRLKDNPEVLKGSKDFIMALQPKTWDWWDGSGKGVGFIAHEFMEVAKYSGNGEKDATEEQEYEISPAIPAVLDEEGNEVTPAVEAVMGTRTVPVYQSIQPSSSEVMANIVAFIQEQQAMIEELKAKVAALEAA